MILYLLRSGLHVTRGSAECLLTRALAGYDSSHIREVALYRTWLAEGHAKTGDLDAARTILDHLNTAADSVRLHRRIDAVTNLINRRTGRHTTPPIQPGVGGCVTP